MRRGAHELMLVLAFASACAPTRLDGQSPAPQVRTIPVRFPDAAPAASNAIRLTIAESPSRDETTFSGDVSAVLLPSGHVVVVDRGTPALREFDGRGAFVRSVGKSGQGPGEFERLSWIAARGDTLFVNDDAQRRIMLFVNGRYVRQLAVTAPGAGAETPLVAAGVMDGNVRVLRQFLSVPRNEGLGRSRERVLVVGGARSADAGEHDGDETFLRRMGEKAVGVAAPPFRRRLIVAVGRTTFATGDTDTGVITLFDRSATPLARFAVTERDRRITPADVQARLDRMFGSRPPDTRARWEAQQREMLSITERPAFETFMFDDQNRLWIQRYDRTQRGGERWIVIDARGRTLTSAILPPRCTARHARARLLAATCLDEDDRPSVRLFETR